MLPRARKLHVLSGGWTKMDRLMAHVEFCLSNAHTSCSKIVAESYGQLTVAPLPPVSAPAVNYVLISLTHYIPSPSHRTLRSLLSHPLPPVHLLQASPSHHFFTTRRRHHTRPAPQRLLHPLRSSTARTCTRHGTPATATHGRTRWRTATRATVRVATRR